MPLFQGNRNREVHTQGVNLLLRRATSRICSKTATEQLKMVEVLCFVRLVNYELHV